MSEYDANHLSRTALLFARQAGDIAKGVKRHSISRALIVAGSLACTTRTGQAALLTAVKTAVRAFGEVVVVHAAPNSAVLGGPAVGLTLGEAAAAEGAILSETVPVDQPRVVVVIGDCPAHVQAEPAWLLATWSSWTAFVAPIADLSTEAPVSDGNVLAAVAAAALAVAEAFFVAMDERGNTAGRRRVALDLWSPDMQTAGQRPELQYAPVNWWLLGLGHLGQGYAHAISWLDYAEPTQVQVVLQDTQRTVTANHSTGVLTPSGSQGDRKTRIVADALDHCGFDTVILERRMTLPSSVRSDDVHVALVGVDNLATRRDIDTYGWRTVIDVGLGAGPRDFDGLTVIRFPGRKSAAIPAWKEAAGPASTQPEPILNVPGLDACGQAELNGVAVGACFVGVIAGVVAIAEVVRPLHGGNAYSIQCFGLRENEFDGATTTPAELPVAVSLRIAS